MVVLIGLFVFNCGGNNGPGPDLSPDAKRKTIKNIPDWCTNPPQKEGYKYEWATATSQDMQMALDKARLVATSNLASSIDSEWNGLTKRAQEETGKGSESHIIDQFSKTIENVISRQMTDVRVSNTELQEEQSNTGYIYKAYIQIEFDEGAAQKRLLAKIKADEQLYTAMRATELFDEMEKKVEAYRERYNK